MLRFYLEPSVYWAEVQALLVTVWCQILILWPPQQRRGRSDGQKHWAKQEKIMGQKLEKFYGLEWYFVILQNCTPRRTRNATAYLNMTICCQVFVIMGVCSALVPWRSWRQLEAGDHHHPHKYDGSCLLDHAHYHADYHAVMQIIRRTLGSLMRQYSSEQTITIVWQRDNILVWRMTSTGRLISEHMKYVCLLKSHFLHLHKSAI